MGYSYIFKLQTLSVMRYKESKLEAFKKSLNFTEKMATALEQLRVEALKSSRKNRKDKNRRKMKWILTRDRELINLDRVSFIYLSDNLIKFEFEVGEEGENEYEQFNTPEEASIQYEKYIAMLIN